MKKFLLATGGLVALGFGAPASAADLAARPSTKAPPPMIAALYDWSGFYIGANGGWGWGRKRWGINNDLGGAVAPACREGCHDGTGRGCGGPIGFAWPARLWRFRLRTPEAWAGLR